MEVNRQVVKAKGQSFFVEIKCTQNGTWQGIITWVEEKKSLPFRSALEMIKLIDSTLEDCEEVPKWFGVNSRD